MPTNFLDKQESMINPWTQHLYSYCGNNPYKKDKRRLFIRNYIIITY